MCFALGYESGKADSLSIRFQLADLKEDHEVILGVTGSCRGASHSAELCGRHWGEKRQEEMSEPDQTGMNWRSKGITGEKQSRLMCGQILFTYNKICYKSFVYQKKLHFPSFNMTGFVICAGQTSELVSFFV